MKITKNIIHPLVKKHIDRYSRMLSAAKQAEPGYREDELEVLLDIWVSIERKDCDPSTLSREEKAEVTDALLDEIDDPDDPDAVHWEW